jgi:hypothetical protein
MTTRPHRHHDHDQQVSEARADWPRGRADGVNAAGRGGDPEGADPCGRDGPLPNTCFLRFRTGRDGQAVCTGQVSEGGHCEYHLRAARARAIMASDPNDLLDESFGSVDRMIRSNEPVRGLSKGHGLTKPKYVWRTERAWKGQVALRRPSQPLGGRRRLKRAEENLSNDPVKADLLQGDGWNVFTPGVTGLPGGRPPQRVRYEETLWAFVTARLTDDHAFRRRLIELWGGQERLSRPLTRNQKSAVRAHLLSAIPNLTPAEAMRVGLVGERAARNLVRAGNTTKGEGGDSQMSTAERLERIEARLSEIQGVIGETLERVRERFPDDDRVAEAVNQFIVSALSGEIDVQQAA